VAAVELAPWERIVSVTNGGGGYGHPAERDPALVLDDVLEGWVSRERAESEYSVVLRAGAAGGELEIDEEATGVLRTRLVE
jgi:N-methylhydantoinase B/oxoprolinase/acetone carboxylase alpha subunit